MQYSLARTEQGQTLGITAKMANRHGLIAGATGTGKTVTLRKMAEAFSDDGVPVFLVDVKGDLSGLVKAGTFSGKVAERIEQFDFRWRELFKWLSCVILGCIWRNRYSTSHHDF